MSPEATLAFFGSLVGAVTAGVITTCRPRSFAQRIFGLGMGLLAAESLLAGLSAGALTPQRMIGWQLARLVILSLLPGTWLVFSLSYSRGNYAEFLKRWKPVFRTAFVLPLGTALVFGGHLLKGAYFVPDTSMWILALGPAGIGLHAMLIVTAVAILANLEKTLRFSTGTMRWQIKFMALGLGLFFTVRIYTSSQALLYASVNPSVDALNAGALVLANVLMLFSIRRTGVFGVEVYPSHRVIYHSLTVLFVGLYLVAIGLLAKGVTVLGGASAFPLKTFLVLVAFVGLAVVAFSDRVRQRTKRFVSRHFRRPQYDYRAIWSVFASRTASLTAVSDFCREVTRVVSEIFDVLSVTIWLSDERLGRWIFGGSTSLSESQAKELESGAHNVREMTRLLSHRDFPFDMDQSSEPWVEELKRCNPGYFREGGNRIGMPLISRDEVLGIMTLGDRVSGVPYSAEELDLLKTIGNQVAASLLNIRLSNRLIEAKEIQAFQTMSTFFVHDLKNTSSTLSLTLQNMPKHLEDPAFREDALSAVANGVKRINELIQRLTSLRQTLDIHKSEVDLNDLVKHSLGALNGNTKVSVEQRLNPVAPISADGGELEKVITNLLLNAIQASPPGRAITVETYAQHPWLVLAVRDHGRGMSAEFIRRSLFRPFQTTKKEGMGIGLFQNRLIVEAHGGRIEVESEEGKGSTFRVLLPEKGGRVETDIADR